MNSAPPSESIPSGPLPRAAWRWAPLLVGLILLAIHVAPMWRDLTWPGTFDTGYSWFVMEVDRASLADHGQLPLWNPYSCGGAPHLGNPQTGSLSPFNLLAVITGVPVGYRLGYTLALLLALLGMRAFARTWGLSEVAAVVAGTGYAVCGAFAQHMGGGHWGWIGFAFFPLMLRSLNLVLAGKPQHLVWGALALAMIILQWAIYSFAYAVLTLPVYATLLALQGGFDLGRLRKAWQAAATMIGLAFALTAVRLLPVFEHISAHPRLVKDRDYTWPYELFETYALRHTARGFGNHQYVFPEFGNYIGLVGLGLVLCGGYLVVRWRRSLWPIVAGAVTFALFQLGNLVPLPWWLLKKLPIFHNLRVPSRFTIIAGMFMCVLIGVAIDQWGAPALERWRSLDRRRRRTGVLVLILAGAFLIDAVSFNRVQWIQSFGTPAPTEVRSAAFHQVPGNKYRMYAFPRANQGTLSCWEETPIDISPRLRPNLPADEYLLEPDAGSVRRVRWSPNRIDLDVDLRRPATVVVNQNFGPGWRVTGGVVANEGGLLAARVPAGQQRVSFRYLPGSLVIGGIISAAAVLVSVAFLVKARRRAVTTKRPGVAVS